MNLFIKKLLVVALAAPTLAFAQADLDKVAATVAGEPITNQEVQDRASINLTLLKRAGKKVTKAQEGEIAQGSFNEIIEERVMLHEARRVGISVSDMDVERYISELAQAQGVTTAAIKANVTAEGRGEKAWTLFNRDIKNEEVINRLRKQEVFDKIQVSQAEIDAFLDTQKLGAKHPIPQGEMLEALHIYVDKTTPASMKKIQAAKKRIAAGEAFETVGATVTESQEPVTKVVAIALTDKDADPAILNVAKNLADGAVSDVIKTKAGLHLLKSIARKTVDFTLAQQNDYAKNVLKTQKAESSLKTWYTALMEDAKKNLIKVVE